MGDITSDTAAEIERLTRERNEARWAALVPATRENLLALPIGARIVFVFHDGSCAYAGCRMPDDASDPDWTRRTPFCDADGAKYSAGAFEGGSFLRLPDDFRFWCEERTQSQDLLPRVAKEPTDA